MIVLKLHEGLAGQMLQYSLGRHLSIKSNTGLVLDLTWFKENFNPLYPREFRLDKLKAKFELLDRTNLLWKIRLTPRLQQYNPFRYKLVQEEDFTKFDARILQAGDNIVLDGYFNSYKYFDQIRDVLLEELVPNEPANAKNQAMLSAIQASNSVSIHFRRGDYALTSFHGMLTKEYYDDAMAYIGQRVSDPQLFIFSDEPDWVMSNMTFPYPYQIVDFNKDEMNYWDIELMRNCKHNIIANSGFSWWGAWLNNHKNKIVIAPQKWVNLDKEKIDNIPADWILK